MSIVLEKLDNRTTVLDVDKADVTYLLLADQPGEKQLMINLNKPGVKADILGVFMCSSGEMKVRTTQHHIAEQTTSDLLFKAVLLGESRFDYHGLIKIDQKAQGSNAYQRNDNLSLHDLAQVETQPELEILANEVRCTHGATVGRMDEEQIYYLMTRGLSESDAEQVLIEGFLGEVAGRINDLTIREKALDFLQSNLGK